MNRGKIGSILIATAILFAGCSAKTDVSMPSGETSTCSITTTLTENSTEETTSETELSSEKTEESTLQTEESTTQKDETTSTKDGSEKIDKSEIEATGEERSYLKNGRTDKIIEIDDFTSSVEYFFVVNNYQYKDGVRSESFDIARAYPKCAQGDDPLNVTSNLEMPNEVDGFSISWESSDESLIRPDGTVICPHDYSRYVLLTAVISKDGHSLISRNIVRVARDLYAGATTDQVLDTAFANDPGIFASKGIDESFFNRWFYELEELDQLYFYEDDVENLFLHVDTRGKTKHVMASGVLSEVHTQTINEAWLNVYAVRKPLGLPDWCELRFDRIMGGADDILYDFTQYYQDVPVQGNTRLIVSDGLQTINSWLLQIPEGFDAKPKISSDEAATQFDLNKEHIDLSIMEINDQIKLVWHGYVNNKSEYVMVDAHTGKELSRGSTAIS